MPEIFFDPLSASSGPESSSGQAHILRLSEVSVRDVTVTVQIVNGTALVQSDVDFNFFSSVEQTQIVTIPAGETSVTFFVEQNADGGGNEIDENYVLEVTDPVNATLAGGFDVIRQTAVIIDDGRALFVSQAELRVGRGTEL